MFVEKFVHVNSLSLRLFFFSFFCEERQCYHKKQREGKTIQHSIQLKTICNHRVTSDIKILKENHSSTHLQIRPLFICLWLGFQYPSIFRGVPIKLKRIQYSWKKMSFRK